MFRFVRVCADRRLPVQSLITDLVEADLIRDHDDVNCLADLISSLERHNSSRPDGCPEIDLVDSRTLFVAETCIHDGRGPVTGVADAAGVAARTDGATGATTRVQVALKLSGGHSSAG